MGYSSQAGLVIAGLDPAIQPLTTDAGGAGKRVDTRVKPAHDGLRLVLLKIEQPISFPTFAIAG